MAKRDAFHEGFSRRDEARTSSDRTFAFVFTVVFTVIGLWPATAGNAIRWWAIAIAALFLATSLVKPGLLSPLNRLWTRFGLLMNKITSPFLMGLIFFLVVTPIGLTMRVLGKRPLELKFDPNARSYWIKRDPPGPAPETMKNQY
jgi:uncharacterized ion transporter superfamily protein YfcC